MAFLRLTIDLTTARSEYRKCMAADPAHCDLQLKKVTDLQRQSNIAENYLHRYCAR